MHFDHGTWYNTEGKQSDNHKYFTGIKPSGYGREKKKRINMKFQKKGIYSFKGKGNEIIPWDEPFPITA